MMVRFLVMLMLCSALAISSAREVVAKDAEFSHDAWDVLLKEHVHWNAPGTATTANYAGFQRDHDQLKKYLAALAAVPKKQFDTWDTPAQRAFLINAYNAYTVELILSAYPDIASIRDLGGLITSAWKKRFFRLLDQERHLDDVEHGLLRGAPGFDEPRIHFAVNCASVGCPALRPEAFQGAKLDAQLEDQTRRFLSDRSRNRLDRSENVLYLSSIFDWYGDDFAKGYRGADRLEVFLSGYAAALGLSGAEVKALQAREYEIDFLDYDWSLNDAK
jgi:Protein of unknown function, DUF547